MLLEESEARRRAGFSSAALKPGRQPGKAAEEGLTSRGAARAALQPPLRGAAAAAANEQQRCGPAPAAAAKVHPARAPVTRRGRGGGGRPCPRQTPGAFPSQFCGRSLSLRLGAADP